MQLSIIIPAYNVAPFLFQCVETIYEAELELNHFEIIIVEDGSSDNTLQIATELSNLYSNIKLLTQPNSGVGLARNRGLKEAKGEYVYFLDPDDLVQVTQLMDLVNISRHQFLDITCFCSKKFKGNFTEWNREKEHENTSLEYYNSGYEFISKNKFKNEVWWYIIRRDFLEQSKILFIENRWMEDAIFTTQILLKAKKMGKCNQIIHYHRIWPYSAMNNKEPLHYSKVIYDNLHAAVLFKDILSKLNQEDTMYLKVFKRLKTRQESFCFFLLIRFAKSDLRIKNLHPMLQILKEVDSYPIKNFVGGDYSKTSYKILLPILNTPCVLIFMVKVFRHFQSLLK